MTNALHPELTQLLNFYLAQRKDPPPVFTHALQVIPSPTFFSVQKLQQYLNNPLLTPDWVHLRSRGQTVPLDSVVQWKLVQSKKLMFMDKDVINTQLQQGAAIVLEGIDIMDADINRFVAKVDEALPCSLANCVAFFSQRDNEAYGGHCDTDDVLVIQLEGEKVWQLYKPQQRRYVNNSPLNNEQLGPVTHEVTMRPGDALYVRAGVPHLVRTPGEYSLHLAFDLCDRIPNIEQITHEANTRYNTACEDTYQPATKMVDRYVNILKSAEFQRSLVLATQQIKNNATLFRQRIGRSTGITALDRYIAKK